MIAGAALGFTMPISAAFLLIAGLGLGSALPSTPGYVGIYQFVAVTVLEPFGFSRTDAIAYILVAQALRYVVIGFWGALGLCATAARVADLIVALTIAGARRIARRRILQRSSRSVSADRHRVIRRPRAEARRVVRETDLVPALRQLDASHREFAR